MAIKNKLLPLSLEQNPSSTLPRGLEFERSVQAETENILTEFFQRIPDSYQSSIIGPFYTQQFQAAAEVLAQIQIVSQEVFEDTDFDFTRPEYLFQILGSYLFPDGDRDGVPDIDGDVSYRSFLQALVVLALKGGTPETIKSGVELLTDSSVEIHEKFKEFLRNPSAESFLVQFGFEVFVSNLSDTYVPGFADNFPEEPFVTQSNADLVLQVLKPAHTYYEYSHLFQDSFKTPNTGDPVEDPTDVRDLFEDTLEWVITTHYYEDFRKFCTGAKEITGTAGETLTDRRLFQDVTRSFASISPGSFLVFPSSEANKGSYRVEEILYFPFEDSTARAYTTSPTGLTGTAIVSGDMLEDTAQDFSLAVEGEILEFTEGLNIGTYRLEDLLGANGGPLGSPGLGPATEVRVSPSLLHLKDRMPVVTSNQTYSVTVDRLGVLTPKEVIGEDLSNYFIL